MVISTRYLLCAATAALVASVSTTHNLCNAQTTTIGSSSGYLISPGYTSATASDPAWQQLDPALPTPYVWLPLGSSSSDMDLFDYEGAASIVVIGRPEGAANTALYEYEVVDAGLLGTVNGSLFNENVYESLIFSGPTALQTSTVFTLSMMFLMNQTETTDEVEVMTNYGPISIIFYGGADTTSPNTIQVSLGDDEQTTPTVIPFTFTDGNIYRLNLAYQYEGLSTDIATLSLWEWSLADGYQPTENYPLSVDVTPTAATGGSLYTAGFDSSNSGTYVFNSMYCIACANLVWDVIVFPGAMTQEQLLAMYPAINVPTTTPAPTTTPVPTPPPTTFIGEVVEFEFSPGNTYYTATDPLWFPLNTALPTPYLWLPLGSTSNYSFLFDYEGASSLVVIGRPDGPMETALCYNEVVAAGPLGTVDGTVINTDMYGTLAFTSPADLQTSTVFTVSMMFLMNQTETTDEVEIIYNDGPMNVVLYGGADASTPNTIQASLGDSGLAAYTILPFNFTDGNIYKLNIVYQYQNLSSDFAMMYLWEWSLADGYQPTENYPIAVNVTPTAAEGGSMYTAGFDSYNEGTSVFDIAYCDTCSMLAWDIIVFPGAMTQEQLEEMYPALVIPTTTPAPTTTQTPTTTPVPTTNAPTPAATTVIGAVVVYEPKQTTTNYTAAAPVWLPLQPDVPAPYIWLPLGSTSNGTELFDYVGTASFVVSGTTTQDDDKTAATYTLTEAASVDAGPLGTVDGSVFNSDVDTGFAFLSTTGLQNSTVFTTSQMFLIDQIEETDQVVLMQNNAVTITLYGGANTVAPNTIQTVLGDNGQTTPTINQFTFTNGNIYRINLDYQYLNISSDFGELYLFEWAVADGYLPTDNYPLVMDATPAAGTGSMYTTGFDSGSQGTTLFDTSSCNNCSVVGWDFIAFPGTINQTTLVDLYTTPPATNISSSPTPTPDGSHMHPTHNNQGFNDVLILPIVVGGIFVLAIIWFIGYVCWRNTCSPYRYELVR
jgi:hypothetical protein